MPTAEIVAIGTELLLGDITDTNSRDLGRLLAECGIAHYRRATVGDNLERCAACIREALTRADIVFTIGGLGPTQDDITRDAIAAAVDERLVEDSESIASLRQFLASRNREWSDIFARQAMRPEHAVCLPNRVGTAPGIHWSSSRSHGDRNREQHIFALPGPRNEFAAMLEDHITPFLRTVSEGTIASTTLRIVGMPESAVQRVVEDLMQQENPTVAPYAKLAEVHLRVTAHGRTSDDARALIAPCVSTIRGRLGNVVYSEGEKELPEVVLEMLLSRKATLATAESCTGGMLGERITSVPGSSRVYLGGFVTYTNEMKSRALGVARTDLDRFGAVSETVALQMAEGVRRVTGADYGIGITGIAGPDGGSEEKPVGLVFVSLSGPRGSEVRENRFLGDRHTVRFRSTQVALDMLRLESMR